MQFPYLKNNKEGLGGNHLWGSCKFKDSDPVCWHTWPVTPQSTIYLHQGVPVERSPLTLSSDFWSHSLLTL